jgi:hypothetical protein
LSKKPDAEPLPKIDCNLCEASGSITADEYMLSKPAVLREIEADKDRGETSRTEEAIISGKLQFQDCEACGGVGSV